MIFQEKKYNIILFTVLWILVVIIPLLVVLLWSSKWNDFKGWDDKISREPDDYYEKNPDELLKKWEKEVILKSELLVDKNILEEDKKRIENLQKLVKEDFYLKTEETKWLEQDVKIKEDEIKKLSLWNIVKINPSTWKEYKSIDEFKKERLSSIPNEIKGNEESLSKLTIDSFKWAVNPKQDYEKAKVEISNNINQLKLELDSIKSNNNVEKFYYYSKEELNNQIKSKEEELKQIKGKLDNVIETGKLIKNYKDILSKKESSLDLKDVLYIHQTVLWNQINQDEVVKIDLNQAQKIIDWFKNQQYVKLTKKLAVWVTIQSDILYVWIDGEKSKMYFDENFYFSLEKSIKNGYKEFYVFRADYNKEYEEYIYNFLTWIDSKQNYFDSITYRILDAKTEVVSELISKNKKTDIEDRWIIKELVKIIQDKKDLKWTSYSKYQVLDLLNNCF